MIIHVLQNFYSALVSLLNFNQKISMKKLTLLIAILLATTTFAQVPSYVPTNGLVAFYPFNNNGNDISGYNNNLIQNGNILFTQNNHNINFSAAYFANGNDYFTTPTSSWSLINNFSSGSVSFYVKIDSQYVSNHYFGIGNSFIVKQKHGVGEDLFFGMQDGTTNIRMQITGSFPSPSGADLISNTSLTVDTWHHVVGTWDGVYHKLFIDGVLDNQISNSNGISNRPTPDYFSIGSILYGGNGSLNYPSGAYGALDDIGIWNRALTDLEIVTLFEGCNLSITSQPQDQNVPTSIGTANFSVSSSNSNTTYQWQTNLGLGFQNLSNAGQYSGVTSSTLSVSNLSMTNNNQVFRCLINDGGCTDTSTIATLTIIDDASISETGFPLLSISPNPTTGAFIIAGLELYNTISTMRVSDVNGKLVKELDPSASKFNLETVKSGVYFLTITAGDKQEVIKIIKE